MFEIDAASGWEVSEEADNLSNALFGASKKSKNKRKKEAKADVSQNSSSLLVDSDDEIFTKKGLKKIKEKRRREKKQEKMDESDTKEKSISSSDTKTKKMPVLETLEPTIVDKISKGKGTKAHSNMESPQKKSKKRKNHEVDEDSPEGPKKKKTKMANGENEATSDLNSVSTEKSPKKKRKRNRKKKNNSKKNKYAHLALNRKENKVGVTTGIENNTEERYQAPEKSLNLEKTKPSKQKEDKSSDKQPETDINGIKCHESEKKSSEQVDVKKTKNKKRKRVEKMDSMITENNDNERNNSEEKSDVLPTPGKKIKSQKILKEQNKSKIPGMKKIKKDTQGSEMSNEERKITTNKEKDSKKMKELQQRQKTLLKAFSRTEEDSEKNNSDKSKHQKKNKKEKKFKELGDPASNNESKNTKSCEKKQAKQNLLSKAITKQDSGDLATQEKTDKKNSIWGNKTSSLGSQAQEKLNAARFRYLNEQLYSCQGKEALQLFKEDPEAFQVYHTGFENQASKWPVNPVNVLIKQIIAKSPNLVIADFGCGNAKLAQALPQRVHSFDLVALNSKVKACDMSNVPLQNETVDIAVFCLSLMGTNLDDYICEANRVLKTDGLLKIVEVSSRFKGLSSFLASVCSHGFQLLNKRDLSQMFYLMDFKKVKSVKKGASTKSISLKPCLYKRR